MKRLLTMILLFAIGFLGTGALMHPASPVQIQKLMHKDKPEETDPLTTTAPETEVTTSQSKETTSPGTPEQPAETTPTTVNPDPSAPIRRDKVASTKTDFVQLTGETIKTFLADPLPSFVIIGNFSSEELTPQLEALHKIAKDYPIYEHSYMINTNDSTLERSRGAISIDENIRVNISPSIYYQRAALIYYHMSLKDATYESLLQFFQRLYESKSES